MPMANNTLDLPPPVAFIQFRFEEDEFHQLLALSSLLYDIELALDLSVILSDDSYYVADFTAPFVWCMNRRRIAAEHRARAGRVVKISPLFLEVAVAAIGGIWVLVQIVDKV